MSHVTHMNESCHTDRMSHVTHANESWHTYECVMSVVWMCHVWMSHVPHTNDHGIHMHESRHIYKWVMSRIWMSHVTLMHESCHEWHDSCHAYEWVMSHIWMGHLIHMTESRPTHEWGILHSRTSLKWMSLLYRVAKTHRMPYPSRLFSAKELYN